MKYVKQEILEFTDTNLTDKYNEWNGATTYVLEIDETLLTSASMVRYGSYYYRSLTDDNVGFNPVEYEYIKWMKYEVSNKFAMLDLSAQSKSIYEGDMTVTFALTKSTDTIGVGYYTADTIHIELLDSLDDMVWEYTTDSTLYDGIVDWWTWMYPEFNNDLDRGVAITIPNGIADKCRVTFNKWSGDTNTDCGFLTAGEAVYMGKTSSSVNFKFTSYATKDIDDFGTLKIVKRAVQDVVDFDTQIDRALFVSNKRKIKSVYNDIIMFIVDDQEDSEFENLLTLGVIQDVVPLLTEFDKSTISWSILESI